MRRAPSSATRRAALGVMPARGGSRTTTSGAGRPSAIRSRGALPASAAHELDVGDAVGERVLARPLDRLGDDLDADHAARGACERKADRARAAVEVPDDLAAGQRGLLDRVLVEHVGHLGVRLQEGAGRDAQAQAADLLLEPGAAEQRPRRDAAGDLGHAVVDRVQHADDARGALVEQRLEILDAGQSPAAGHEDAEQLARAHALAHDQVPQVAGVGALVVGLEALGACPVANASRTALPRVARQQADLDAGRSPPSGPPCGSRARRPRACSSRRTRACCDRRTRARPARSARSAAPAARRCAAARRAPAAACARAAARSAGPASGNRRRCRSAGRAPRRGRARPTGARTRSPRRGGA